MVRYWPTTAADLKMPWREPYRLTGSEPISRRGHVSQSPESSIEDGMHSFQFCRAGSRAARTSLLFRRLVDHLPELSINVRRLIADDFRGPTSPKKTPSRCRQQHPRRSTRISTLRFSFLRSNGGFPQTHRLGSSRNQVFSLFPFSSSWSRFLWTQPRRVPFASCGVHLNQGDPC